MDDIDKTIIKILTKDSRTPNTEIAQKVNLSEGSVRARIDKLISSGAIKNFTITLSNKHLTLLEESLKIYSPSGQEKEFSDFLFNTVTDYGFLNVTRDSANNVIGEIGEGGPVLLLCGHMDTVPGLINVEIKDNVIYGRGASDAKSSLISMLIAASSFKDKLKTGKIIFAAVTDEEGTGAGIRELIKGNIKPDCAIFGEPSGIDKITVGYKGRFSVKFSCNTPSVHASAPWMSSNSIELLFKLWNSLKNELETNVDNHYQQVTSCLTQINGGIADNVMPGKCDLICDIRYPFNYDSDIIVSNLDKIVSEFNTKNHIYSYEIIDSTPAFESSKSSVVSRSVSRAIIDKLHSKPQFVNKTGTGDMNVLGTSLEIPVITYGPGNPHLSHTSDESIVIDEFLTSIDIYKDSIHNFFNLIQRI
jgi:LysW-gamma-L-lysine carboxypeptidase